MVPGNVNELYKLTADIYDYYVTLMALAHSA